MTAAARGRANRARGNRAESAVARWLTEQGWPATTTRNAERGAGRQSTTGDIAITDCPHIAVEVKCVAQPAVTTWLAQLDAEVDGPHKALIWKQPGAAMARPGEWLTIVADHPIDWLQDEVYGRVLRGYDGDLDARALRSVTGWLDVEHTNDPPRPVLGWVGPDWSNWLLMRLVTFAADVLPIWESPA